MDLLSSKLRHAEAPVKTSPSNKQTHCIQTLQFHTPPALGQGGTAGQAFQTLTKC